MLIVEFANQNYENPIIKGFLFQGCRSLATILQLIILLMT